MQSVHRPAYRDQQKAKVDEERDRQRDIVALGQAAAIDFDLGLALGSILDGLYGFLLQRAQFVRGRRQLEGQYAIERCRQPPERFHDCLRTFDSRDMWFPEFRQLVDRTDHAAQGRLQLRVRTYERAAVGLGKPCFAGAIGQLAADLS